MKWSFSVAVATAAEVAAAVRAQAEAVVKNINETETRDIGHADYVPDLDKICTAADALVAQLPEVAGKLFSVNVLGHIDRNDAGDVIDANAVIRIDLVRAPT